MAIDETTSRHAIAHSSSPFTRLLSRDVALLSVREEEEAQLLHETTIFLSDMRFFNSWGDRLLGDDRECWTMEDMVKRDASIYC